ncbi:MAG: MFS transporter [Rhizonema sp. PD38]|nr:MFS transporter [Rhizonema sp. PD38]
MTDTSNLSTWAPLRRSLFRDRWIASILSNVGSWMQDTAGVWLMTSLTTSPFLIALMQTAATLPMLFLGILAGATADIFDRRRLLIFWQSWMLVLALILSGLTLAGAISPLQLLTLTFLLSLGNAMGAPAWQAIVPELVPRSELPTAIALNSAGFNLARAIGPALGGLVVAATGAGVVFSINAISFIAVIAMLKRWHRQPLYTSALPAERMLGAVRSGLRYIRYAPAMQAILIRAFVSTICVSVLWALLPLVAQRDLNQGALGYGILNGCLGFGAVLGAALLPKLRQRFSSDNLVVIATLVFAVTLLILAYIHAIAPVAIALILSGIAWISMTSSFNIAVQLSVPAWVQARALGIYQMVFQGSLAVGSALWGILAQSVGASTTFVCAGIALLIGIPVTLRYRLMRGAKSDLTPALNRTEPQVVIEFQPEEGPVLVTVEYNIDPVEAEAFVEKIHHLRSVRLRDGAIRWGIYHDTAYPTRYLETFVVESWLEHLRQHERVTVEDRAIRAQVFSFHQGSETPIVSHMIYAHKL